MASAPGTPSLAGQCSTDGIWSPRCPSTLPRQEHPSAAGINCKVPGPPRLTDGLSVRRRSLPSPEGPRSTGTMLPCQRAHPLLKRFADARVCAATPIANRNLLCYRPYTRQIACLSASSGSIPPCMQEPRGDIGCPISFPDSAAMQPGEEGLYSQHHNRAGWRWSGLPLVDRVKKAAAPALCSVECI